MATSSLFSPSTRSTISPIGMFSSKVGPSTMPNMSVVPSGSSATSVPPVGVRAVSPTTNVSRPPVTLPAAQQVPSSPGSYKGTTIQPGSNSDIQAQIAKIDQNGSPSPSTQNPTSTGSTTPTGANTGSQGQPGPTYPGLMGQMIQGAQNPNNPNTFSGLVGGATGQASALNTTAGQLGTQGQMTPAEAAARQQLAGIPGLIGSTDASIESHPSDSAFQMGREAVAGRNIEAQRQSLADQVAAYAAERSANTAAYTGQASAQNQAGGLYQGAANLGQPQVTTPGQAVFNPLTGTYSSASSGGGTSTTAPSGIDQNSWNQYVQDYSSGNFAAIPSSITGNANLAGQLQAAVQSQNPSFDYSAASGAASGRQNLGATAGGIQSSQQQQIASYKSAQQQGQNLASQVTDLISHFGLNPSDVNAVNAGIQKIAQNTSSPQYQILSNYLNDVASRYSQVLTPPGGTATDTTRAIATSMLNATASGTSIQQVLQSLDQQASAVIAGVPATGTVPGSNGSSSNSGSGFGWNG